MASPPTTNIPMEVDPESLPADIPEAQDVHPESHDEHDGANGDDATTSKRKAPRKPRSAPAKPADRVPGTTSLPVARVKRILGADEDLQNISKEALFLISIATVSLSEPRSHCDSKAVR
jgi:DNA polymerase epsilon subunit 4